MNKNLPEIFAAVENRVNHVGQSWQKLSQEISQYLPETYQPEIQEISTQLAKATEKLLNELHHPTLAIATTGTTSSGKSTLVNLLCGAEIAPVAVSEMSAGVVTIEYSLEKSLVIQQTPGATWECGEWQGISETEICQRLNRVMTSYLDRKQSDPQIACPISLIRYPFRLQSQLQLPPGTKVKIMDLPGLAYVGDEGNANLIRQCREALCLVTYNSAETDPKKINSLLQEVVEQVKELGGSPARMLFVLNRIDVFRADNHWPESQRGFIEKTTAKIKTELKDRLREYTQEIEHLQVSKLSSWPALLALQIQSDNLNDSNQACKKADNHFNALIEEVLEDLPRKQEKWSEHDRQRVADALWEKSYAAEFEQHLREHITQHFPQLVIPQLLDQFKTTEGNTIQEWAIQTSSAILNSSEARYQQEIENLKHIKIYVKEFIENSGKQLRNSFNNLEEKIKHCLNKKKNQNSEIVPENTIS